MVKRLSDRVLNVRLPANEVDLLEAYCLQTNRTKTDVVRELVRSLRRKLPKGQENADLSVVTLGS